MSKTFGVDPFIYDILETGYKIPFVSTPPIAHLANSRSAIKNSKFVTAEVIKLLANGCVVKCSEPPAVVNPLSVASNSDGKLRLILDLRHVNLYLYKFPVVYEGFEVLVNYVVKH